MTKKELTVTLIHLYTKWEEDCLTLEKHKEIINMLHKEKDNLISTITGLEDEICLLNAKLESMLEFVSVMNNNSYMLDDVFEGNMKAVGFDYSFMNKKDQTSMKEED